MIKTGLECQEQARNSDYECNRCGGDVRGLKCCNPEYCDKVEWEEDDDA